MTRAIALALLLSGCAALSSRLGDELGRRAAEGAMLRWEIPLPLFGR